MILEEKWSSNEENEHKLIRYLLKNNSANDDHIDFR